VHNFAEVPQMMPKDEWLRTHGMPALPPPNDPDRKMN